jgi:hypothetical protein
MSEPQMLSSLSNEVLQMMLQEYAERLRQSNSLVWAAASAFLPVSLAGIAIYEITGRESTVTFVGVASIILIWLWYLISARFPAFVNHDRAIKLAKCVGVACSVAYRPELFHPIQSYLIWDFL